MKNMLRMICMIALMAFTLSACVNGKGDVVIKNFEIGSFTKIDHGIKGDIILVNDNNQFVEVHAQENIMDILKIENDGGTLKLRTKAAKSIGNYDELKFYVHMPKVEHVKIGGRGTVTGDDITGNKFTCRLTADGKLTLTDVDADFVEITVTGAGQVTMEGKSKKTEVGVGSSGRVECFELSSDDCEVQLKGNGFIKVLANNNLKVWLSGSGTVYYKGNPHIDPTVTGSGIILNAN